MKLIISWILRFGLSAIFLYAGVLKFLHPDIFYKDIQAYLITPDLISYFAAYFLPTFEIILAICIFSKSFLSASLTLLFGLTCIFIMAIISAWFRGLDITCGCFGSADTGGYFIIILRDIFILISICLVYIINSNKTIIVKKI